MSRRRTTRTPRPTPAARVCETPRCDNPAADGWGICRGCYSATAGRLSDLGGPWLVELGITLTGRSQIGPESVGGRSAETALPLSVTASREMASLRALLVSWCLLLRDEAGAPIPADSIPAMAEHCRNWLDWLAKHPAVGEMVDEMRQQWRSVERAIDLPAESRVFAGPCPVEDCPGEVWAIFPIDEWKPPVCRCRDCGARWNTTQWDRLGRLMGRQMNEGSARRFAAVVLDQKVSS